MGRFFCGWYFKCYDQNQMLAVIPAFHKAKGKRSCSIQLITNNNSYSIPFSYQDFHKTDGRFHIEIEKNVFSENGLSLNIDTDNLKVFGDLYFGKLSPIKYDIMGPFKYVPLMECRHSVLSMYHTVNGTITINGEKYIFQDGAGYIEGDRGRSFPKEYAWTHCFFPGGSLMLSVAEIPFGIFSFTGIIGVIWLDGREHRIATYLGAKAVKTSDKELIICQKKQIFSARLVSENSKPLKAPQNGNMMRIIHENPVCCAEYRFQVNGDTLLHFKSENASFEYEYPIN